jgi:hypothetical protein
MILLKRKFVLGCIFGLCFVINCQTLIAQSAPAWVGDYRKVYPESEWICVVESAGSRTQAQAAASSALANVFKIDVKSLTSASLNFSNVMSNSDSQFAQNNEFNRQVNTTSDITGLMGVLADYWTDPKTGTVYSCARMNKREGAVTYTSIITANDNAIAGLKADAAGNPGTFEAYQTLSLAVNLATITDNYLSILAVLNSAARQALKVSYGNASAVDALRQQAARAIVITVRVKGQEINRIATAFEEVFSSRGFRTKSARGDNPYVLEADFRIQETDIKTGGNIFVRYELSASLLDAERTKIFSFSENKRQGHISLSEAKQRALRAAETAITDAGSDGFATDFDNYLASLLH